MKKEYDFASMKGHENPYAKGLKKLQLNFKHAATIKTKWGICVFASGLPWFLSYILPRRLFVDRQLYLAMIIPVSVLLVIHFTSLRTQGLGRSWRYILIGASLSCLLFIGYCVLIFIGEWSFHPS